MNEQEKELIARKRNLLHSKDYQEIRTQKPEQERVEEVAEEISSMQLTLFNYISIE